MPTTPYARLLTSVEGGAATAGAHTVVASDEIQFSYESTVGWPGTPLTRIEFYSYPEGWAGPGAPWTEEDVSIVGPTGSTITYTAYVYRGNTPPPQFNMPAAWGKYLAQMIVNDGVKGGAQSEDVRDTACGLEILSSAGLHDIAWREGSQFATEPWRNWQGDLADNLRTINTALGLAAPVVTLTAGAGMTGGGDTSANRTFNVIAHADASIVVNADSIQVGVLASDAQHGTRGGGTTHAAAVDGGASGYMTGAQVTKLAGIEAGANITTSARVLTGLAAAAGDVAVNNNKITGLATGTASTDAATVGQTDTAERDSAVNPTVILTSDRVVYLDRNSGVVGATLPAAASMAGITLTLINNSPDAGDDITITADGTDKIGMGASTTFTLHAGTLKLRGKAGRWAIISYYDVENI
jgi:hypothetical protein